MLNIILLLVSMFCFLWYTSWVFIVCNLDELEVQMEHRRPLHLAVGSCVFTVVAITRPRFMMNVVRKAFE